MHYVARNVLKKMEVYVPSNTSKRIWTSNILLHKWRYKRLKMFIMSGKKTIE
uniref:Uncharacterized protein n=1 Tax=Ascaris lumbricoides TaxID=6252 RepID=A0A0M3IXJ0_ASCLU